MRRALLLLILFGLGGGCRGAARRPPSEPAPEDSRLRARAEAFLKDTLSKLAPGKEVQKLEESVQYRAGDLFKAGHEVCVAAFIDTVRYGGHSWLSSPGLAFFSRAGGGWKLRSCSAKGGQPLSERAFELKDLSGDGVPEVLFVETYGATGNVSNSVYRYDAAADSLLLAAEELGRPEWDGKQVLSFWKGGNAGFDNVMEGHDWVGGRKLGRRWRAAQVYSEWTHPVGSTEGLVELEYAEFDDGGGETYSWQAVGNLPSYRNLIGEFGTWGPDAFADIRIKGPAGERRRIVHIKTSPEKMKALGVEKEWLDLVSRAVLERPERFSAGAVVKTREGRAMKISDFAAVSIEEDPRRITYYRRWPLGKDGLKKVENLARPGQAVAGPAPESKWKWFDEWRKALAAGASGKAAVLDGKAPACLFIYAPTLKRRRSGSLPDDHFVVRAARWEGRTVRVDCEVGRPPAGADREFQVVAVVPLGRLGRGGYQAIVTIRDARDGGGPPRRAECAFRVGASPR